MVSQFDIHYNIHSLNTLL